MNVLNHVTTMPILVLAVKNVKNITIVIIVNIKQKMGVKLMENRLTVGIVSDDSIEIIWSQDGFPQIIYSNNVWYGHLKN